MVLQGELVLEDYAGGRQVRVDGGQDRRRGEEDGVCRAKLGGRQQRVGLGIRVELCLKMPADRVPLWGRLTLLRGGKSKVTLLVFLGALSTALVDDEKHDSALHMLYWLS